MSRFGPGLSTGGHDMPLRGLRRWGSSPLRTSLAKMPWSSWVCKARDAQSGRLPRQARQARHTATVAGCGVCLGLWRFNMVQLLSNPKNSWQIQRSSFCLTASGFVARLHQRSQKSLAILDWKADSTHQPESGTA